MQMCKKKKLQLFEFITVQLTPNNSSTALENKILESRVIRMTALNLSYMLIWFWYADLRLRIKIPWQ